ncbi:MAG: hypothetical protein VYA95_03440 [Candidatus Thermoplasmatota archaeon]|nr:hypothetical protein [Candidatus Thermoplasmatota archaeon]
MSFHSVLDNRELEESSILDESNSSIDYFALKNSNDWSSSASAANPVVLTSVESTTNNEVVVAGIMSGSTTMSLGSQSITSSQNIEPWIAKADANGNWQWIQKVTVTGTSSFAEVDLADISVAPNGDIFATGRFYESISFGSITLTSTG